MKMSIILLSVWCLTAAAAEHRIECPKEIKRESIQITRAPEGWTPFYPFEFQPGLPLNAAGLMLGPPASMTMSKPSWFGVVGGHDVERWTALGAGEKWMACYYGDHGRNDAILSRPIDSGATECSVTYPRKRGAGIQIVCKW